MSPSDIISIAAVAISVISMAFTTVFSILQVKHNKNSVRPIASINVGDYENRLFVQIKNVGTGPMTICSLRCKDPYQETDALIHLMPEIDQNWETFEYSLDDWTIPVGGSVTLIEIVPQNDAVRTAIRKKLSTVSVSVSYCDIYHTKFSKTRELSFFGRTLVS